jgi:hypothetical protein
MTDLENHNIVSEKRMDTLPQGVAQEGRVTNLARPT